MIKIVAALDYLKKPVLPKEHGAWLILAVSLLVGSFAVKGSGGIWWGGALLISIATLSGFMSFKPLLLSFYPPDNNDRARYITWVIVCSLVAGACFIAVVLLSKLPGLAWFVVATATLSVVYFKSTKAKVQKSLTVKILGIIGLSLACLAASLVQERMISQQAVTLYVLLVIWFIDRMIMVQKSLDTTRSKKSVYQCKQKLTELRIPLMVHIISLVAVSIIGKIILSMGLLAVIPFLCATTWNLLNISGMISFSNPMKTGFAEMRLGFAFCIITVLVWRLS
ncbi:MAG TPA: YwiC-like family protein [Nitrospinota bacterium]|nr:YwiC-like family protein [Nitrospinota bacterium]|tara:strand:- start:6652 stop:7494 length:843 start_codon:yes stop_codon:yes gene_type:complete